jgi:pentatricopeptide repeat protein
VAGGAHGGRGREPDVVTWTTLVDGWMKKGDMASAQQVVERMGAAGVKPDVVTWNSLVGGFVKKGDMASAQQVVERMGAAGVEPDVVTYNTLISGSPQAGRLSAAQAAFDEILVRRNNLRLLETRTFTYFVHFFAQPARPGRQQSGAGVVPQDDA